MIVVDSSVWISFLRAIDTPEVILLKQKMPEGVIVVGDVVLLEVLQGARDDGHSRRIEKDMRSFPIVSMMNESLALEAARLYRLLRGDGITIRKSNDLVIATFCLMHRCRLLHADRDFVPFERKFGLNA